jgi:hypothetical protein
MPSTFQDETREEADAVREAREQLEQAVEALPDEPALFEAAQMHASLPPVDRDRDRKIAQRYAMKLDKLEKAVSQFRHRLREYEEACSEYHYRQEAV